MALLDNKVALVTGAGPNIGREIAKALADAGALVACNDTNADSAASAAAYAAESGPRAMSAVADIRDEAAVAHMFSDIESSLGPVDIVVNNAARTAPHGILETPLSEWEDIVATNLTGMFIVCKAAAAAMVAQQRAGSIVNIASTSGHRGRAGAIAYCASKGGVLNFTRAMANDLAPYGIRVNSVSPTKTGVSVNGLEKPGERFHAEIPLGRLGTPAEQAQAVLFLASDLSSFCTGIDVRVDGGAISSWGLPPAAIAELIGSKV